MKHRKVQCWIFSNSGSQIDCLILKTIPERGGYWQPVTGTVEPEEGYFEAACREPMEETGFEFTSPPIDIGFEFEFTSKFGVTKERVFALHVDGKPDPKMDQREHLDFKWVKPSDALKMIKYPSNIEGLKKSYESIFKKAFHEN